MARDTVHGMVPEFAWQEGYIVEAGPLYAQAVMLPQPLCMFCKGTGRRELEIEGIVRMARCRCQRLPDRVTLFNQAHIPARHAHCTMENFQRNRGGSGWAWDATNNWLRSFQPVGNNIGAVFYGPPGRGKTHLMCAVLRELIFKHGVSCRFIEFTHLLSAIRESIDKRNGEITTLTPLADAPILAIDELGKGRKTDFEISVIDEIVTRRYNARKPILATTNFGMKREGGHPSPAPGSLAMGGIETLPERLGERVFSRIKETAWTIAVEGEDFRVTKGR